MYMYKSIILIFEEEVYSKVVKKIRMVIVGVIGMVGRIFLKVLEERNFLVEEYFFFVLSRLVGIKVEFMGREYIVEELKEDLFDRGIDIVLFFVGVLIFFYFVLIVVLKGCVVIDNLSVWCMEKDVFFVVLEVNLEDIKWYKGIIVNFNCLII